MSAAIVSIRPGGKYNTAKRSRQRILLTACSQVTVQGQQNPAMLGCPVGNSSVFQSEEGIGEGKVLERSLIPANGICLGIEDVPLWRGGQNVPSGRSLWYQDGDTAHIIPSTALMGSSVFPQGTLYKE